MSAEKTLTLITIHPRQAANVQLTSYKHTSSVVRLLPAEAESCSESKFVLRTIQPLSSLLRMVGILVVFPSVHHLLYFRVFTLGKQNHAERWQG